MLVWKDFEFLYKRRRVHFRLQNMRKVNKKVPFLRKQKTESRCLSVLKKQALEFCRETGLHGYKYIGQSKRSKIERIIWALAVFISLCSAIVLMKLAWDYYSTHPSLTVIESTHRGIWNYPFPAVTVCNINRVSRGLSQELIDKLKLPSNISKEFLLEEIKLLNELLHPGLFADEIESNLTRLQDIFDFNNLSIHDVVDLVTRNCSSLIKACRWKGESVDCNYLFLRSYSRNGLCCSFNYISAWREKLLGTRLNPLRVSACGHQTGLTMLINIKPIDYHASIFGSVGVKVMLHEPFDYPDFNARSKLIDVNVQAFLTVKPEETYSTSQVRAQSISTRNCIFSDEGDELNAATRTKENFTASRYSYLNCMTQCRATAIRAACGCIPYFIPQNVTRPCNLRDVGCLKENYYWLDSSWPGMPMFRIRQVRNLKRPCGCRPDCTFYRYNVESSKGSFDPNVYSVNLSYTTEPGEGRSLLNHSVVHIFFGDLVSMQYRRNVYYSWRNLFATFGGLLGLFSGFSLISVFELIYFFIIRIITDALAKKGVVENVKA